MVKCKSCDSLKCVKNGFSTRSQLQRHKCNTCGFRFTSDTKTRSIPQNYLTCKAIQLYLEGMSYKYIANILGVTPEFIGKLLKPYKKLLNPIRAELTGIDEIKIIQHEDLYLAIKQGSIRIPKHSSGFLLVGNESRVYGVSKRI